MPSAKRILLVGGDPVLRGSLAEQLRKETACDVDCAATLAEARSALREEHAALILDSAMPDGRGEDFARELRGRGSLAPILLLADQDAPSDIAETIAKPFRFSVLLARLNARMGRHAASDAATLKVGPYFFRPTAKLLTDGGKRKIRLTEKETNILKFLHNAARAVPRETLLHEVWGYSPAVTTHTLETHIYRLRRKIEQDPAKARILVTENGGYRLA